MSDEGLTAREAGAIMVKLDLIDEHLRKIDARLDAGDRRFQKMDKAAAAEGVVKKIAMWIGGVVLAAAGAVGLAVLSHIPFVAEWLIPPKH